MINLASVISVVAFAADLEGAISAEDTLAKDSHVVVAQAESPYCIAQNQRASDPDIEKILCTDVRILEEEYPLSLEQYDHIQFYDHVIIVYINEIVNNHAIIVLRAQQGPGIVQMVLDQYLGWLDDSLAYVERNPNWTADDIVLEMERDGRDISWHREYISSFVDNRFGASEANQRVRDVERAIRDCTELLAGMRPSQRPANTTRQCHAAIINGDFGRSERRPDPTRVTVHLPERTDVENTETVDVRRSSASIAPESNLVIFVGQEYAAARNALVSGGWSVATDQSPATPLGAPVRPSDQLFDAFDERFQCFGTAVATCSIVWSGANGENVIITVIPSSGRIQQYEPFVEDAFELTNALEGNANAESLASAVSASVGLELADAVITMRRGGWRNGIETTYAQRARGRAIAAMEEQLSFGSSFTDYHFPREGEDGYAAELIHC